VGRRLRAGQVSLNYPAWDTFAPFGGYKQSGNGREYADWGIHDFCEVKASWDMGRSRPLWPHEIRICGTGQSWGPSGGKPDPRGA
jgi:hypothetical protein